MVRTKKYLILLILDCFVMTVHTQSLQNSHFFHTIKQTDGLSNGWNAYLYRDSYGFVWICSVDGLNRFDGLNVKVYKSNDEKPNQIKGNNIQSDFFEDKNHNIWFSTYDYINCYRRKTDDFEAYQVVDEQGQVIKSGYRTFHLDNNKSLWVQVGFRLFIFDIINKNYYQEKGITLSHRYAQLHKQAEKGETLFSYSRGLGVDFIELLPNKKPIQHSYFYNGQWACTVNDIFRLNTTTFLLGTDLGLLHFDTNKPNDSPHIDSIFQGFSLKNIVALSKIPNSNELLITTSDNGIFSYDIERKVFTYQIKATNKTSDNPIFKKLWRSYVDSSSHLWLTTIGEGVRHTSLQKSKFVSIPIAINKNQLSVNYSNFIEDDNKQILAIAYDGLVCYKNQKYYKSLQIIENQKSIRLNHIIKDKLGSIWVATNAGLYQLNKHQNKFEKKGISVLLTYLYQLQDGRLLCSGKGGVFELSPTSPISERYFQGIADTTKNYSTIYQDQNGTVFITQNYESILVYRKKNLNFIADKELPITGTVSGFYEDKKANILWIGTSNGLVKLNKTTLEYQTLTEQHGLPNQYVCGLLGDEQSNIWLSTNKGLVRYSPTTNIFRHYQLADGLLSEESIDMAFMKASDGIFWLGNSKGINTFQPNAVKDLAVKARIQLIAFNINDTASIHYNITELTELILPYKQNTVSFNFVAIEYSDSKNTLLQYRLKNHDDKWLTVKNTEGRVRYANLSSGTYYLQIKAANSDGVWSDTVRELKITILTPWYRSWWFITFCVMITMALVGYIAYLRLSKIIDLQEIRIKLYENLHDDLGSRLTAIVMMIDPILQKIQEPTNTESINGIEEHSKTLTEVRTLGSNIVNNMYLLVWATNPSNDELSNVVQQMRTDKDILLPKAQLIISMDTGLSDLKVDGNKRYQMLSIFNEALTNISKYAEATRVTIMLESDLEVFTMTIKDNGKGFDTQVPKENNPLSGGNGFRNMRNRAKRINGKLSITSTIGEGTTIILTFSLRKAPFLQRFKDILSKFSPK